MYKSFIFLFFYFFVFTIQAQSVKDTVINNKPFVIHTVQKGETLYSLSREYNTELNQIVVHNPSVMKGFNIEMKILIPVQDTRSFKSNPVLQKKRIISKGSNSSNKSTRSSIKPQKLLRNKLLEVALLLPFYLEKNELLEDHNEDNDKVFIYPKSKTAIEYYSGVRLALDTLEQLGHRINMSVFDISNDSIYQVLLNSDSLNNKSLIIGPLLASQFNQLGDRYGLDRNKRLVSPLSYKNVIKKYPNTYQFVPFPKIQMDTIVSCLNNLNHKNIIVIGQESEKSLFKNMRLSLAKKINFKPKSYFVPLDKFPDRDSLKLELDSLENIILLASNNRSFVSRIIPMLASMEDTAFTVFGLESWNKFTSLDQVEVNLLNIHLPSVFFQDDTELFNDFIYKYYYQYNDFPSKYSYAAYKQFLFLFSEEFDELYSFKKIARNRGFLNVSFPIMYYQNFEQNIIEY